MAQSAVRPGAASVREAQFLGDVVFVDVEEVENDVGGTGTGSVLDEECRDWCPWAGVAGHVVGMVPVGVVPDCFADVAVGVLVEDDVDWVGRAECESREAGAVVRPARVDLVR